MNNSKLPSKTVKDLGVYKASYSLAMDIFNVSKAWPAEEKYSLTDQIRRSSRSVCANLREAWAKRRYEAHFISKLTDSDAEIGETKTWLAFAKDCGYLNEETFKTMNDRCKHVGAMLGTMMKRPNPFLLRIEK